MWRRSKLKNIVWHSSHYRHIAFLKRTHKQVEIRYSVLYKTTCIHSERILIVSPEILHTERDELVLLSTNLFPSLIILRCLWTNGFVHIDLIFQRKLSRGRLQITFVNFVSHASAKALRPITFTRRFRTTRRPFLAKIKENFFRRNIYVFFKVYFIKAINRTFCQFISMMPHSERWENTRKSVNHK